MPTITVKVLDVAGNPVEKANVYVSKTLEGTFKEKDAILRGATDASGTLEGPFSVAPNTKVIVRVRCFRLGTPDQFFPHPEERRVLPNEDVTIVVALHHDTVNDQNGYQGFVDEIKAAQEKRIRALARNAAFKASCKLRIREKGGKCEVRSLDNCEVESVTLLFQNYITNAIREALGEVQTKLEDERDGNAVETAHLEARLARARETLQEYANMPDDVWPNRERAREALAETGDKP
jgi:hypothetical protein